MTGAIETGGGQGLLISQDTVLGLSRHMLERPRKANPRLNQVEFAVHGADPTAMRAVLGAIGLDDLQGTSLKHSRLLRG